METVFYHIIQNLYNILSSIILSILTPLAGVGVLPLDRAFSLTLGAQIGTTITGLLAALANMGQVQKSISTVKLKCEVFKIIQCLEFFTANFQTLLIGNSFQKALQIALVHFFFNVFGTLIWGTFPFMRAVPIKISVFIGELVERYRWVGITYVIGRIQKSHFLIRCSKYFLNVEYWHVFIFTRASFRDFNRQPNSSRSTSCCGRNAKNDIYFIISLKV